MTCLIALDQGTSSSRTIIFNTQGDIIASAQQEFTQFYPKPGWVEHDPEEILRTQTATVTSAFNQSGLSVSDIAAVGITNQRETIAVWDRKTGQPLHNAIVWQDRRTADTIHEIADAQTVKQIREKTGLPLDPYFSGTKIKWLLDNHPEIKAKAERKEVCFGTVDSWLVYRMTGGKRFVTDSTNACRTLLMNIHTGQWDDELCRLIGVHQDCLPEILPSNAHFCTTDVLGKPLPIHGIAGDQQAALFGQMCFEPGDVKNTYGTGCFILAYTGDQPVTSQNRLLTTVAWQLEGGPLEYALEGSVFIGGAAVQWLRDGLKIITDAAEINRLAASVQDTGGVTLVPAFAGLGAPYWNPKARGLIAGITRGTGQAHIARATLESIALQSSEVIAAMSQDFGRPVRVIRTDGGASASNLLMQMQADFTGSRVVRSAISEVTALGAALLAGIGKGVFADRHEPAKCIAADRTFEPVMSPTDRAAKLDNWKKVVQAAEFLSRECSS